MPNRTRETYRMVTVSLSEHEADEADRLTDVLRRAGWPKANRSLIIREALLRLEDDLAGQDDKGVFRYFVERSAARLGHPAPQTPPRAPRAGKEAVPNSRVQPDLLEFPERK